MFNVYFIRLKKLRLKELPAWNDPKLEDFVLDWLTQMGFPLEGLEDTRYNYALQELIILKNIGEKSKAVNSTRLFNEFKFSVCVVLLSFIPGSKYYKDRSQEKETGIVFIEPKTKNLDNIIYAIRHSILGGP
ncbi:MAG: hypothetical protein V4717_14530 [Bacteroidota bacterium]